jgi:hypothetical protein
VIRVLLTRVKQACITWKVKAAAASHIAKKDESRLVISIDFKTDLIDLFEAIKRRESLQGSKFDKGIPRQFHVETFNHSRGKTLLFGKERK